LAERANDADRKARLREAAKQWVWIWPWPIVAAYASELCYRSTLEIPRRGAQIDAQGIDDSR
jgi:hypothetical protein